MKILSVLGTGPEAVKMAPIIKLLEQTNGIESRVCNTAQHRQMIDQVLELFEIKPDHDLDLMREGQTLAHVGAGIFTQLDPILTEFNPDWVLAVGDTTTVVTTSLLALYHKIKFGHIEAGLRTHNKWHPFPEEINRRLATVTADRPNPLRTLPRQTGPWYSPLPMANAESGFEIFAVTADKGIRAWGADLAVAFRQAAQSLWSLMVEPAAVEPRQMIPVAVEAGDRESLLVAWLNELLYLYEAKGFIGRDCTISNLTDARLDAVLVGESVDPTRHIIVSHTSRRSRTINSTSGPRQAGGKCGSWWMCERKCRVPTDEGP